MKKEIKDFEMSVEYILKNKILLEKIKMLEKLNKGD